MRSYHQYPKCGQTVLDCEECSCTAAPAPLPEEEAFTPVFDAVQRMYREGFSGDAETIQRYITDLTRRLAEAEARPLIPAGAKVTIHTPPMPESELVSHLQRQIVALHKEIHRLREAAELRAAVLKQENEGLSSLCEQHEARVRELEAELHQVMEWARQKCECCAWFYKDGHAGCVSCGVATGWTNWTPAWAKEVPHA